MMKPQKLWILFLMAIIISSCTGGRTERQPDGQEIIAHETEGTEDDPEIGEYDESLPLAQYFEIVSIHNSSYEANGQFVLEMEVRNIYAHDFSKVTLSGRNFVKMKNQEEMCDMVCEMQNRDTSYPIKGWKSGETKTILVKTPVFNSLANRCLFSKDSFNRTPEEIFLEVNAYAISSEEEPQGTFARFDILDNWKLQQERMKEQ